MTLADLLPTLRSSLPHRLDPSAWPASTRHAPGGDLVVGGVGLRGLAPVDGRPVLVADLDAVRHGVDGTGTFVDCDGGTGLAVLSAAGVPDAGTVVHGRPAAGRPVPVGSLVRLRPLERLGRVATPTRVVLTVGGDGFDADGPALPDAVRLVTRSPRLQLDGLYCAVPGDADAVLREVDRLLAAAPGLPAAVARLFVRRLQPDGADVAALGRALRRTARVRSAAAGTPAPFVLLDPGAAAAAPCVVALHRVHAVRGDRLALDTASDDLDGTVGGVRPAHVVSRPVTGADVRTEVTDRVGRPLTVVAVPRGVRAGDVLAVAGPGRLWLDRPQRAEVVGVRDGRARTVVRALPHRRAG